MRPSTFTLLFGFSVLACNALNLPAQDALAVGAEKGLQLAWQDNFLEIRGPAISGGPIRIHYLEAYCRAQSTDADWQQHTVIGHRTRLVDQDAHGTRLHLECRLNDGLIVNHKIEAVADEVRFEIVAHNPTDVRSQAHWAQPCIRLDRFTGCTQDNYLPKCFVFVDKKLQRMPFEPWAEKARYTPGQVWHPASVPDADVNPRPVSTVRTSNGLIGCYSQDESQILAVAFEPYQELFQGVIVCLHSDFRLGGIPAGESRTIQGKIYITDADIPSLLKRYKQDFPEHH